LAAIFFASSGFSPPPWCRAESAHAACSHGLAGADLVPHQTHVFRRRADEGQPAVAADLGEFGIFGEKAVTGVNGVGIGHLGGADDRLHVQVALGAGRRPDTDALVGQLDVQRRAVDIRMHCDGLDPQLLAGTNDAQGDLAAIGDEYFMKHAAIWTISVR
jgi:hypothetical protein